MTIGERLAIHVRGTNKASHGDQYDSSHQLPKCQLNFIEDS